MIFKVLTKPPLPLFTKKVKKKEKKIFDSWCWLSAVLPDDFMGFLCSNDILKSLNESDLSSQISGNTFVNNEVPRTRQY